MNESIVFDESYTKRGKVDQLRKNKMKENLKGIGFVD